jgi:hypothetical protein
MKSNCIFLPILLMCITFAYGGSLQGTVRDALTLDPIEGVNVTVHVVSPDSLPFPTTTDHVGKYSIMEIVPGNKIYVVVTHMAGYTMSYTSIDNLGSLDLIYDIFLTGEGIIPPGSGTDSLTVIGTIMTPTAGTGPLIPIANAQVKLISGYQQFDVVTNPEGKYTTNIPSGIYSVTVSAEGYNNLTITGVHAEQAGATVDAVLQSSSVGTPSEHGRSQPMRFILFDAYPNPFNPTTTISFSLPSKSFVSLKVFDALGREVSVLLAEELPAGTYTPQWNASNMPSGVYFYRLQARQTSGQPDIGLAGGQAGTFTATKKLSLLK